MRYCLLFPQTFPGTHKGSVQNLLVGKTKATVAAGDPFNETPIPAWLLTDNVAFRNFDGLSGQNGNPIESDATGFYFGSHWGNSLFVAARGPYGNLGPGGSDERIWRASAGGDANFNFPGSDATPVTGSGSGINWPEPSLRVEASKGYNTFGWTYFATTARQASRSAVYLNGACVITGTSTWTNPASLMHNPYASITSAAATSTVLAYSFYGIPLNDAEMASLHNDPYQIFVERPFAGGAGSNSIEQLTTQFVGGQNPARFGDFNTCL
jgi:hypothetical protein